MHGRLPVSKAAAEVGDKGKPHFVTGGTSAGTRADHADPDEGRTRSAIQTCVQKIYANTDGSFSVDIGVHTNGCGRGI